MEDDKFISCGSMVRLYLERNGYDGLAKPGSLCGCHLDNLMPCGGDHTVGCVAGVNTNEGVCGKCGEFHIVAGKKK